LTNPFGTANVIQDEPEISCVPDANSP